MTGKTKLTVNQWDTIMSQAADKMTELYDKIAEHEATIAARDETIRKLKAQLEAGLEMNFIGTPKTALGHTVKEWVKGTIALLKEMETQ